MISVFTRRSAPMAAVFCGLGIIAGCAGSPEQGVGDSEAGRACSEYQGHNGTKVTISSPIVDVPADKWTKAWEPFQDCTFQDCTFQDCTGTSSNAALTAVESSWPSS
jgi:hypothetical protein